jgi:hypothetical protein
MKLIERIYKNSPYALIDVIALVCLLPKMNNIDFAELTILVFIFNMIMSYIIDKLETME